MPIFILIQFPHNLLGALSHLSFFSSSLVDCSCLPAELGWEELRVSRCVHNACQLCVCHRPPTARPQSTLPTSGSVFASVHSLLMFLSSGHGAETVEVLCFSVCLGSTGAPRPVRTASTCREIAQVRQSYMKACCVFSHLPGQHCQSLASFC